MDRLSSNPERHSPIEPKWYQDLVIGMVNRGKQIRADGHSPKNSKYDITQIPSSMNFLYKGKEKKISNSYDKIRTDQNGR